MVVTPITFPVLWKCWTIIQEQQEVHSRKKSLKFAAHFKLQAAEDELKELADETLRALCEDPEAHEVAQNTHEVLEEIFMMTEA
jgi:Na+-transporting NADH:ubiquinone oxidoreductase subunit NqrC